MKLYLTNTQRNYILEILRASENNAINGEDAELALAFNELYEKIKPINAAYISLNRNEADTIVEFCEIVRKSLDDALSFLNKDKDRDPKEIEELKEQATKAREDIEEVIQQLQQKIKNNPVKDELNEF